MESIEVNRGMPQETINECPCGTPGESHMHSKGKPDASFPPVSISVRFATNLPVEYEIRPFTKREEKSGRLALRCLCFL